MPDDKTIKQPQDANRVNIHEPYEMNYWSQKWGVTKQQIIDCVKRVGDNKANVARCLGK